MSTWLLELLFALMVFAADIVFADVSSVIVGMHETWVLLGMCKCHHSLFAFGPLPSIVFLIIMITIRLIVFAFSGFLLVVFG